MIEVVRSTTSDAENIDYLIALCFGDRKAKKILDNIEGRYFLCYEDGNLIAMSGLYNKSEFNGLEIDWTCTHPDYRRKGYMKKVFATMLAGVDTDVYCSAWRVKGKELPNLHSLLSTFGFIKVVEHRVHLAVPFNCYYSSKAECVYYTGVGCSCREDLYLRA